MTILFLAGMVNCCWDFISYIPLHKKMNPTSTCNTMCSHQAICGQRSEDSGVVCWWIDRWTKSYICGFLLATEKLTDTRTGWWQLKYLLFFSPIWGRFPFWQDFERGWNHQIDNIRPIKIVGLEEGSGILPFRFGKCCLHGFFWGVWSFGVPECTSKGISPVFWDRNLW